MQKINTKKMTKEQMAKLLEEAQVNQQAAEKAREEALAALSAKASELSRQGAELDALRAGLEAGEKALDEARRRAQDMTINLEMLDEARKKAEAEKRELAEQLGKRTVELGSVKGDLRKTAVELNDVRAQLAAAESANAKKELLLGGLCEKLAAQRTVAEWCIEHPWRNLWRAFLWWLKGEPVNTANTK